jgi:3-hydroxyacyl-[acyl-carrier-protein] dehydratase
VLAHDLETLLPHRAPILLLQRVIDLEPGVRGTGVRVFRDDDACFAGHFPGQPILPGVLTIEALAQTLMVVLGSETRMSGSGDSPTVGYLQRVEAMSFHRPIVPGDEVRFTVEVEKRLGRFVVAGGRATVGDALCAKGTIAVAREISAESERN